jgi:hypothetical protein
MGYDQALERAWNEIAALSGKKKFSLKFLADEYEIDYEQKRILSLSCNVPAKEFLSIILLHYLIQKQKSGVLPQPGGDWVDFRQIEGGDAYYPAFQKRVIGTLLRKFAARPDALWEVIERLPAKKAQVGDRGVVIEAFPEVPVLVTLWKADEEFKAEANLLFDRNIRGIFCTEDIVVLAELVVRAL